MESEPVTQSVEETKGVFGGFLGKFTSQIDMKMGIIIAIAIIVIGYFGYSWMFSATPKTEGLKDGGKKNKKKENSGNKKDSSEEEISDLVDKIEEKQSKNSKKK